MLVSCAGEENQETTATSNDEATNEAYEHAIAQKHKTDSINATLEWTELKPGLWQSKHGDLAIADVSILYLDSMIMMDTYLTHIDTSALRYLIDVETFENIGSTFFKDKHHVYLLYAMAYGGNLSILGEADAASFEMVGSCYAKDKNKIYTEKGTVLSKADYDSFFSTHTAGCFGADKDHYYFWDEVVDVNGPLDSLDAYYISLLDQYRNAMDTIYSYPADWETNPITGKTKIDFKHFDLRINSFFQTNQYHEDTVLVLEDVGEYLIGRDLIIKPKNENDTFHLYIQSIDYVYNMMETDSNGFIGDWETFDHFQFTDTSQLFYWKSTKKNHYIFPDIGYDQSTIMGQRIKDFGFTDTTYWYHGEMFGNFFGHAWLYEGHIVDYMIYSAFVKIERHNNGLQETKWLRLEFSYGC
jgi:hypothetical protein